MTVSPLELPLRDIHLPDPVSWWPPAPGWWLVVASTIVLVVLLSRYVRKPRRSSSLREISRLRLAALTREYDQCRDQQQLLGDLSTFLRRASLRLYGRAEVASLTGEEWLGLLDKTLGSERFSRGPGRILASGPYQPNATLDPAGLLALCRKWVDTLPEEGR